MCVCFQCINTCMLVFAYIYILHKHTHTHISLVVGCILITYDLLFILVVTYIVTKLPRDSLHYSNPGLYTFNRAIRRKEMPVSDIHACTSIQGNTCMCVLSTTYANVCFLRQLLWSRRSTRYDDSLGRSA